MSDVSGALGSALFEGEGGEHDRWRRLLSTEPFRRSSEEPPERQLSRAYERLRRVNAAIPDPLAFVRDPVRLAGLHEWLGFVDTTLTSAATIHYNLFLGSLVDQCAVPETDLSAYAELRTVGTFLVTEVAHGNDVAAVETTATYDRAADAFVLHTPSAGAQKFMPNTSPVGGPKSGVVAARLSVDGADEGVFLFLVPLTGAAAPRPGVRIRRLPARMGSPFDHCLTSFDHVRVPRRALLGGTHSRIGDDGRFASDLPRGQRYLTVLRRVMYGKLCMSACAVGGARALATLAVRYGQHRMISTPAGSGVVPVFALRSHHGPLVEAVATTYAMNALYRQVVRRWAAGEALGGRDESARLVSAAKAWITWQARGIGIQARERCGAQGLLVHNGMADQLAAVEGTVTAEGDNQAILAKVATELVLAHRAPVRAPAAPAQDLTSAEVLHGLLAAAQSIWLDRAAAAMRQAPAAALARRNSAMGPALRAAELYVQRHAAVALADAARAGGAARELLEQVHLLFAVRAVAGHSADLLARGLLTEQHVERLPVLLEELIARLAPHARVLVDGFAVPEGFFAGVPLASPDYVDAYDDPGGAWHTPPRPRAS